MNLIHLILNPIETLFPRQDSPCGAVRKRKAVTGAFLFILLCLAGRGTGQAFAGPGGSKIEPPTAYSHGKSPTEWLSLYFEYAYGPTPPPNPLGHVYFLTPGPTGDTTGTGTLADPLILPSHADVTIHAGTAMVIVPISWYGEIYADHVDSVVPDSWWGTLVTGSVTLDGSTVVQHLEDYYVPVEEFNPPLIYAQPTSYGSLGIAFVQGTVLLCEPLSVGVHHLADTASVLLPADNGVLPETGLRYLNSWTITVLP
jgi:hypothetical protein